MMRQLFSSVLVLALLGVVAVSGQTSLNENAVVTFIAGPASASVSTISSTPMAVVDNGIQTSTITVTIYDAHMNPISGNAVTLTSNRTSSVDTISAASGVSTSLGVVTFTVESTVAGVAGFTAVDTTQSVTLTSVGLVTFTLVSAALSSVTLTPSSSILANGVATGLFVVTLRDINGTLVSGKTVTILDTSSFASFDTYSSGPYTTNSSGAVTFTVSSTKAGARTFIITDASDSLSLSTEPTTTFIAGPVSPSTTTVVATLSTVTAGSSTTVTVTLLDVYSNPVSGKATSLVSNHGDTPVLQGVPTTGSNGQAVWVVSSTVAGSAIYTATDVTDSNLVISPSTASVTYVAGPISGSASTLVASPGSVIANGVATSTLTVFICDQFSNAISGKNVAITTSRPLGDLFGNGFSNSGAGISNYITTSTSGIVTFTVDSTYIGTSTYTAATNN